MSQKAKMLLKVLSGRSDSNLSFDDVVRLLGQLGFTLRVKGSHITYSPATELMRSSTSSRKAASPSRIK